ncbi:hypothetical protein [Nocardia tengchongensis]|uniref:hypothetical protein n=1 Tax=Nocardia tengchongensis TaxID=2055889 RepID=UPI00365BA91D
MTTEEEALELGRTTPEVVEIAMQKELCDEARLDQALARSTRRHAMLEEWIDSVNEPPGWAEGAIADSMGLIYTSAGVDADVGAKSGGPKA